jgi:hypothetical protein
MIDDLEIACSSAFLMKAKLEEFKKIDFSTVPPKKIKGELMKYWAYIGTSVWEDGIRAFEMFVEQSVSFDYWCLYTEYAIELCDMIKELGNRFSVEFPKRENN